MDAPGQTPKYVFAEYQILDTPYEQWILRQVRGSRFVLDYGCGLGVRAKWLVDHDPLARVELFDINKDIQRKAEERLHGHTGRFDNYDLVLLFGVLEMLDDEQAQVRLLSELKQRLLPRGKIFVMNCAYNPISERWLYLKFLGRGNAVTYHEAHRFHRSYVSSTRFHHIIKGAGLNIVEQLNGPILSSSEFRVNYALSRVRSLHGLSWYHYYVLTA